MNMMNASCSFVEHVDESDEEDYSLPSMSQVIRQKETPVKDGQESRMPSSQSSRRVTRDMDKLKSILDDLLDEKSSRVEKDNELDKAIVELNADLKKGGIQHLKKEPDDSELGLNQEHKQSLRPFEVLDAAIKEQSPGEHIFSISQFGILFRYPGNLTLAACGFIPGKSNVEKTLVEASADTLLDLFESGCFKMCFSNIQNTRGLLDWMFLMLTGSSDADLTDSIMKTLLEIFHLESDDDEVNWTPSALNIARSLVNLGCDQQILERCLEGFDREELVLDTDKENSLDSDEEGAKLCGDDPEESEFLRKTLKRFLRVIAECVLTRSHLYTTEDLGAITIMMFIASVHSTFTDYCLQREFSTCLTAILEAVPHSDWQKFMQDLCIVVPKITLQHHNLLEFVELLSSVNRGFMLQRKLSYAFLNFICFKTMASIDNKDFKISHLLPVVQSLQVRGECDYYSLSTVVVLLDRCAGSQAPPVSERAELRQLTDVLMKKMSGVKEHISDLDRSRVKDRMASLTSKWAIMLESMNAGTQRTLFSYAKKRPQLTGQDTGGAESQEPPAKLCGLSEDSMLADI